MEEVYGRVYCITNKVNGKIYIGQTIRTIEKRLKNHLYDSKRDIGYLSRSIQKYGEQSFFIKQIDVANNKEDLNELEQFYIDFFMSSFPEIGYNLTLGGDSEIPNEETRKRMSEAAIGEKNGMFGKTGERHHNYGKSLSEKTKNKISEALKGKKSVWYGRHHSIESINLMKLSRKGKPSNWKGKRHSDKTKKLMSIIHLGKKNKMFNKKGKDNPNSKKIICVETQEKFDAIVDVERKYGYKHSNIIKCCRGERQTCGGYHWQYL